MISVRRIGHVTLETPDLDRQIDYFTDIVGLVLAEREATRALLVSRLGLPAVELARGSAPRCTRLSFAVAPDTDFAAAARFLSGHGIANERRSDALPGAPQGLSLVDPIGVAIDLVAQANPLPAPPEGRGIGVLKLGHVAHVVDDPQRLADFYCRILGFRVSDWIGDWFVFLRCGADHHTVNFLSGRRTQMHHVAFELRNWSHLERACDLLARHRIPLIWGPGRHTAGHNLFAYHRNPDDQIVETFAELDQMPDETLGFFEPRPWHRDRPQRPKVWTEADGRVIWGPLPSEDWLRQRQ